VLHCDVFMYEYYILCSNGSPVTQFHLPSTTLCPFRFYCSCLFCSNVTLWTWIHLWKQTCTCCPSISALFLLAWKSVDAQIKTNFSNSETSVFKHKTRKQSLLWNTALCKGRPRCWQERKKYNVYINKYIYIEYIYVYIYTPIYMYIQ
jgi:hypothetical protein